ncbi:NADPH:quinone reductase [Roseateles sp. YR242]|uniref:NADP-dependent oxidoreductase n=1 Tax=Roseateles sp. YR242 TaxID=1855305 RepID=UPI0008B42FA9|nr:NADPH:quinone reductase [Roseateles sp. YR242]
MRSIQLLNYGGETAAQLAETSKPTAGAGQVLVRVHAAGINALDWKIREGYVRDAFPLELPTVLGIELAGVVEAVDPGATRFQVGDRVMGPLGGLGAFADYVAVDEAKLAPTPQGLSDVDAAGMSVAALAAWQSLNFTGAIRAGARVLVHGAAGAVGAFAVQFAHQAGAFVVGTASAANLAYVQSLGADQVIDYRSERFEDLVDNIDLVLAYVGGDVIDRSWAVLNPTGAIVGTSSPEILARTPAGRQGHWFIMKPDAAMLAKFAADVASGALRSKVSEVVSFEDIPAAIERSRLGANSGKVVVDFKR